MSDSTRTPGPDTDQGWVRDSPKMAQPDVLGTVFDGAAGADDDGSGYAGRRLMEPDRKIGRLVAPAPAYAVGGGIADRAEVPDLGSGPGEVPERITAPYCAQRAAQAISRAESLPRFENRDTGVGPWLNIAGQWQSLALALAQNAAMNPPKDDDEQGRRR